MNDRPNRTPASGDEGGTARKGFFLARWWRALRTPSTTYTLGGLLVIGIVLGIVFWGGFNWAMAMTNSETFCISCHEMERNVYREYTLTSHYNNRTGVRATCPDCHVPKEWIHLVIRKIQATNDLLQHIRGTIDTREKFEERRVVLAKRVWESMKETDSRECRNCHNYTFMDLAKQESRSADNHDRGAKEGKTCIDCHKGIVHDLPAGAWEAEKQISQLR